MQAAVNISAEALSPATQEEQVVIAGQSNLLAVKRFLPRHAQPAPRV